MSFQENQYILIRLPSQNIKFVQLVPENTISLGKFGSFRAKDLIGDPYGFTYAIGANMDLSIVDDPNKFDDDGTDEQSMTGHKIHATGLQNLTADEIEELKKQGVSGQDIIDKVAQGHSAFEFKTEFSKEKYLKRKKQKFLQQFTPVPITVNDLLEYYQDKDAGRIMNLSMEGLALMLSQANVRPGGDYLVIDETPGVLTAAVLERIGDRGSVTIVHESEHPNLAAFKFLPESQGQIRSLNFQELLHPGEISRVKVKSEVELNELKSNQKGQYSRALKRQETFDNIIAKSKEGFDGLLVITSLQLPSLIERLLKYMAGSAPVVVFHPYKEALVNLTLSIKSNTEFLAPTIMETRVRKYQTIPGRIHPLMTSKNFGGYILHGYRVLPDPDAAAVGHRLQRKKKVDENKSPGNNTDAQKGDISESSAELSGGAAETSDTMDSAEPQTPVQEPKRARID